MPDALLVLELASAPAGGAGAGAEGAGGTSKTFVSLRSGRLSPAAQAARLVPGKPLAAKRGGAA